MSMTMPIPMSRSRWSRLTLWVVIAASVVQCIVADTRASVSSGAPGTVKISKWRRGRKQEMKRGTIRTRFTFRRPSDDVITAWFSKVHSNTRNSAHLLEFNHDSTSMTNPCLSKNNHGTDISFSMDNHMPPSNDNTLTNSANNDWWPNTSFSQTNQQRNTKSYKKWRVLRYCRRIGKGESCYNAVRDAALDWTFSQQGSKKEMGIRNVHPLTQPHQDSSSSVTHGSLTSLNRDAIKNNRDSAIDMDDCEFSLGSSKNAVAIWSGPHSRGRRLVTYSVIGSGKSTRNRSKNNTSNGDRERQPKTRFRLRLPKLELFVFNPVMVVYDSVDQRGPSATYTSTAYATLKGHLLSGEERVTVVIRDGTEKNVDIEILSYSRPAPSLLGKMIWPLIGGMQNTFFESQMDALERVANLRSSVTTKGPRL